jgi:putative membrane protein
VLDTAIVAAAATATVPGSLLGLVAGLVPGLHSNNLAHGFLAYPAIALVPVAGAAGAAMGSPEAMAAAAGLLFGMALGHAFSDDIPAIFLGAPDADTALSVLPGHRLLAAGLGSEAVRATARGSLLGVLFCLPFVPLLAGAMGPPLNGYDAIRPFFPVILFVLAGLLVLSERGSPGPHGLSRGRARLMGLGLLLASAALGDLVMFRGMPDIGYYPLGAPAVGSGGPLLALFAGLFGIPTLIFATVAPGEPPAENAEVPRAPLNRRDTVSYAGMGTGAGALVGWLPGIGAAQATTIAFVVADAVRLRSPRNRGSNRDAASFLVAASAVGTANLVFNLVALSVLQRERSGVMVALDEVAGPLVAAPGAGAAPTGLLVGLLVGAVACLPLCSTGAFPPTGCRQRRSYSSSR